MAVTLEDSEEQRLQVVLHPGLAAAREARQTLGQLAPLRRHPDLCFTSQLLAGELVANVVLHSGLAAGDSFIFTVDYDENRVRVQVADGGSGVDPLAVLRLHTTSNAHHRGIALVNALADSWGFRRQPDEYSIWFELDLIPGRRPWHGRSPIRPQAEQR